MGEIEAVVAGEVAIRLESSESSQAWLDATPLETKQETPIKLTAGRHKLIVRVDRGKAEHPALRVSVLKPPGSDAQIDIVAGQ
jgi:hypothetical protein